MLKYSLLIRILIICATLAAAITLLFLVYLQVLGFGWGNDLDGTQWVLLVTSLLSIAAAVITAFRMRVMVPVLFLIIASASITFSFYWSSTAGERKAEANRERITRNNETTLANASTIVPCTNGDTAVLIRSEQTPADGRHRKYLQLEVVAPDRSQPSHVIAVTTGEIPPELERISEYRNRNPGSTCSGSGYADLDAMLAEVKAHYRDNRQAWYPDDPLYGEVTTGALDGWTPVDPLKLSEQIQEVNLSLEDRFTRWPEYAFEIHTLRGRPESDQRSVEVVRVEGNRTLALRENRNSGERRADELRGEERISYTRTGTLVSLHHLEHVLDAGVHGQLYVEGYRAQMIKAWAEPVDYGGRSAARYLYRSTVRGTPGDTRFEFEFIVDDETGLVLQTRVLRNDETMTMIERHITGSPSPDLQLKIDGLRRSIEKGG